MGAEQQKTAWSLSLSEVLKVTAGRCRSLQKIDFIGIGTDTRKSLKGQLFIALVGDRFDAHDFVDQAVQQGAAGVMVHREFKNRDHLQKIIPVIEVSDTLQALQQLAHDWRKRNQFTVVGITGSNGKTTTKEFTKTLLHDFKTCWASQGSLNNHWGVPLSLLSASPQDEVIIQEMGMNHLGEIAQLAAITEPNLVVVTMVGSSHIGELGSQSAIAQAKEEIYLSCPSAIQVFNLDNEWTIPMWERAQRRQPPPHTITFSAFSSRADLQMRVVSTTNFGLEVEGHISGVQGRARLQVIGRHNLVNVMAASALAWGLGMTPEKIWSNLSFCRGSWGRHQLVHLSHGARVLFDGYNANPESMTVLLKNLFEMDVMGKKIAVLGEMLELGSQASQAHFELGALVARSTIDLVWFMGPHQDDFVAGLRSENFLKTYFVSNSYEVDLARKIGSMINPEDITVIKGSRAMKMEQVLSCWAPVDFGSY